MKAQKFNDTLLDRVNAAMPNREPGHIGEEGWTCTKQTGPFIAQVFDPEGKGVIDVCCTSDPEIANRVAALCREVLENPKFDLELAGDLVRIYDVIGLDHSQPIHVLIHNFENIKRFSDYLGAIEREFFMVSGMPSEEPEDEGMPVDPECLLSKWPCGSSEEYVEQFRAALATKFPAAEQNTSGAWVPMKLCDLPFGTRFRYLGTENKKEYVLIDRAHEGRVAEVIDPTWSKAFQGLYGACSTKQQFQIITVEVFLPEAVPAASDASSELWKLVPKRLPPKEESYLQTLINSPLPSAAKIWADFVKSLPAAPVRGEL